LTHSQRVVPGQAHLLQRLEAAPLEQEEDRDDEHGPDEPPHGMQPQQVGRPAEQVCGEAWEALAEQDEPLGGHQRDARGEQQKASSAR